MHLADKFRFQHVDTINPNSCTQKFTEVQCVQHIINISACKLDQDHYNFWNEVALRDVKFPEISKCGIQATKFDLREQLAIYKKQKNKDRLCSPFKRFGFVKKGFEPTV